MNLLLVDDDRELGALLRTYLGSHGIHLTHELNGDSGYNLAVQQTFDLIILDVMLPGADGFSILQRLRLSSQVPVIMLTARGERGDRVRGLEMGADDYLAKPFGPEELLGRIRAILRRAGKPPTLMPPVPLESGRLRLFPGTREALLDGRPLGLTAMESEILEQLLHSTGRVVSRDALSLKLYNRLAAANDRSVDTHVSRIRRKLGEARDLILSVRGTGYQLRHPFEGEPD